MTRHKHLAAVPVPDAPAPSAAAPHGAASFNAHLVVTESEAAQMLRLSPRSLQRLRLVGDGPAYVNLTPGRIGYPLANLQAWLAARTVTSTAAATVARKAAGK